MILRLLFLFLPVVANAQYTGAAVSDSIETGLTDLAYNTTLQTNEVFLDSLGNLYTYIGQVPGKQFLAIGPSGVPNLFKFNDTSVLRVWHEFEIDNWLLGATGSNYEGYSFSGIGTITCTITISGDDFTGDALTNTDAFGMAFYNFLIDPDFATYLQ